MNSADHTRTNGTRSSSTDRRRPGGPIRRALVVLMMAGIAVACGPADSDSPVVSPPSTVATALPTTVSPSPSPSPSPTPSPTTATPTPTPTVVAKHETPSASPTRSTPTTKAPTPRPTRTATVECEIVSNAGNCYNAGQFCRNADIGRSTHAGNGRMIYCRQDGSRGRWGY